MHPELYVNGRFFTQQVSGVQSFAHSICNELAAAIPFSCLTPRNAGTGGALLKDKMVRVGMFGGHFWEQAELALFMRRRKSAWLLNLCNAAPLTVRRQAVTLHDLAFLHHPEWFHPAFASFYKFMIPKLARNSPVVFTVSKTIRDEICNLDGVAPERVHVIPNKVDAALLDAAPEKPSLDLQPGNYFLMTGTNNPRKNFSFAERTFTMHKHFPKLVIAGGSHKSFAGTAPRKGSDRVVRTGYVSNGALRWLYENAAGLINPSLYEGFGLPNLEAMAFGCPVICSSIPVFREVCGEAATYFDPRDEASLTASILSVLDDKGISGQKTIAGKTIFTSHQHVNRTALITNILFS